MLVRGGGFKIHPPEDALSRERKRMRYWPCAIPVLLVGLLAGCARTLPSNYEQFAYPTRIESDPSGARIEVNGEYIGKTPLHIVLPRQYSTTWGGVAGWMGIYYYRIGFNDSESLSR